MKPHFPTPTLTALTLLLALALIAFAVGRFSISPGELLTIFSARLTGSSHTLPASYDAVIFQIRGPRVLAAILIGAALSGAGAVYQNMFRNPLVSPDILGVSSGAALGAVLAIFLALPILAIQGFAFAGGLVAVALVYFIGSAVRGHDPILALILTGVVVGTLFGSLHRADEIPRRSLQPVAGDHLLAAWQPGSISPADLWVAVPLVLLGLVPLFLLRWRMNLLSLSDDEARALGVDVSRLRLTSSRARH